MRNKLRFNKRMRKCTAFFLVVFMLISLLPTVPAQAATELYHDTVLQISKTSKEYDLTPAGVNKKGIIYEMKLDGMEGFCMDAGKHASSGKRYARTGVADETYVKLISYALYDDIAAMHIGFTPGKWSDSNYALAQALVWGYAEGCSAYETAVLIDIIVSDVSEHWREGKENNPDFLKMVSETWVDSALNFTRQSVGTVYVYDSGIGGNQRLLSTAQGTKPVPKYDVVSSTKSYTKAEAVTITVQKIDNETSKPLSNVSFDLYQDNVKVTTLTTDANGTAVYTLKEESTKTVTSQKEYCSNYHELSIPNQNLINTDYKTKEQAQAAADAEALAKAKSEAEKGSVTHIYKAVETKTKEAYYLNPSTTTQSINYASGDGSGTISFRFTNTRQMGTVEITKMDSETKGLVDGAVYGLYAKEDIVHPDGATGVVHKKDALAATFPATGTNGKAELNNLYLGKYYVKEITAPNGYVLSAETYDVELIYAGQNVSVTDASTTVSDKVQRGSIEVTKLDKELSNGKDAAVFDCNEDGAQGDASIVGATYGLYAREDIVHPDGTTGIVEYNDVSGSIHQLKATKGTDFDVKNTKATKDALLATIKTDENGAFGFENLYNGQYYVKEIQASEGYLLDKTEYEVDLSYENQNESIVMQTTSVYETVKKQAFDLVKVGHASGSSQAAKPLKGVEFTVKLESDVIRLGWENAPVYDVLTTDAEGKASSIELPYGTYRVRETKAADNYNIANDFLVRVEEDSRTPQSFTNNIIIDEEFQALLKIVKLDKSSGKIVQVAGAEFKVKALSDVTVDGKVFKAGEYIGYWNWNIFDGFYTDTWKTNEAGYVLLNEKLGAGTYQIEEIHAPMGYLLDTEPVRFTISNSDMYDVSQGSKLPIVQVEKADVSVKGQISVEKRGEVLTGFKDGQFIYEEKALSGAKFQIVAKEDILDPAKDDTVLYTKGTLIETLTTDSKGVAVSSKLPLGKYMVKEIEAPQGMVLNEEPKTVELKYADEHTSVVFEKVSFVNDRQKVVLDLHKLDAEEKTPVSGAEFTIYANEDIVNFDGKVILSKDAVVTKSVSNQEGKIIFDIDLPLDMNFYIKETKRPMGYTTLDDVFYLDTSYQGQQVKEFSIYHEIFNQSIRVAVSKTDIVTGEPVIGAELSIIPVDENGVSQPGATFVTWITDENPYYVEYIPVGSYMLVELSAPLGYELAESILFEVSDTNKLQKIEMKDVPILTDIQVKKIDSGTKESILLKDFIFGLYEDKECTKLISTVNANKETGTATFEALRYGTYYIKELEAPNGYMLSDEIKEVIINDELEGVGEVHSFTYENTRIPVTIVETGDTTSALPFLCFGILGLSVIGLGVKRKRS